MYVLDLYSGTKFANFMLSGNSPSCRDLLNIISNGSNMLGASFFSRLLDILSCPLLVLFCSSCMKVFISWHVVGVRYIGLAFELILLMYSCVLDGFVGILFAYVSPTFVKKSHISDVMLVGS